MKIKKKYAPVILEELKLGREHIENLDLLEELVFDCLSLNKAGLQERWLGIGKILYANAIRLELDEDIDQLTSFARSVAGEIISPKAHRDWWGNGSSWESQNYRNFPPFIKKGSGVRMSPDGILSPEESQHFMAGMFLWVVRTDKDMHADAQAILDAAPMKLLLLERL
ncbi:hypothetical protein UNDKW_4056 [Undibacterium sp. KW1]|uniref:hypothetical protein n=1 Tax=Undibacterium sp. KW1 TaxID=2058624 RepID=UPI001331F86A|nr:hypothetical protein [Undibacterium sp. KW1]BBB62329.1 hypothetical protein UNDKW_4056 [Undibacterium sp. KW1]